MTERHAWAVVGNLAVVGALLIVMAAAGGVSAQNATSTAPPVVTNMCGAQNNSCRGCTGLDEVDEVGSVISCYYCPEYVCGGASPGFRACTCLRTR